VPKAVYAGAGLAVVAVILAFLPAAWLRPGTRPRQQPTLPVEAAEMTQLAPLPSVSPDVAAPGSEVMAPNTERPGVPDSPLLTAGSGDVVGGYFDKTCLPPTEP
jgi:hypothetical protein